MWHLIDAIICNIVFFRIALSGQFKMCHFPVGSQKKLEKLTFEHSSRL